MSYPASTLYELASPRYADPLREAAERRVGRWTQRAAAARPWWLPGMLDAMAAVVRRQERLTAARPLAPHAEAPGLSWTRG